MVMVIEDLVDLLVDAIKADATISGDRVYSFRDWPTTIDAMPITLLDLPDEDLVAIGKGTPLYKTTGVVRLTYRLSAPGDASDAGAAVVQDGLAIARRKIKRAVVNFTPLMTQIERISAIRSRMKSSLEGRQHLGELIMQFAFEFTQGLDAFHGDDSVDLDQVDLTLQFKTAEGLNLDLPPRSIVFT